MTEISSYLRYLPPVLWSEEEDPSQFLGRMLCIFERILTGIPVEARDDQPFVHDDGHHSPIEETISNLHQIFDPWRTPAAFLPWLAAWVGLPLHEDWNEYQRRKAISAMVSIYHQRGLKRGLQAYLDLYLASEARPHIAIDDGEAIFRARFADDGTAHLFAVAHSQFLNLPDGPMSILLHPTGLAVDTANKYIVADEGDPDMDPPRTTALWRISCTGEVEYEHAEDPTGPRPRPVHSGDPLQRPKAVVVDKLNRYSVIDQAGDAVAIYRFAPPQYEVSTVITAPAFPAIHPVDMILDSSQNFIILDRGLHPIGYERVGPSEPKILVVNDRGVFLRPEHPLASVKEPTALVMDGQGRFIIADAQDQRSNDPADLIRVDPADDWSQTPLLEKLTDAGQNPLVFPTGFAFEGADVLLVCDTGLRWGYEKERSNRYLAEPAAIYRFDLTQDPPVVARITPNRELVYPTKMVFDRRGSLIISDRGETLQSPYRNWRAGTNEFGVVVYFLRQRTTKDLRNQVRREIVNVVEEQKPGHAAWWMDSLG